MRRLVPVLVVVAAAVAAGTVQAQVRLPAQTCTAFGKHWAHRYNAAPGPIRIVGVCCSRRSLRTGNSACSVKVTVRRGPGHGTFGCSVATVAPNGDILANRPQSCSRVSSLLKL